MTWSIHTNRIIYHCGSCDKEFAIEWLSYFDKMIGKKPKYCPWCQERLENEVK